MAFQISMYEVIIFVVLLIVFAAFMIFGPIFIWDE